MILLPNVFHVCLDMNILYLGPCSPLTTSGQRANSLKRIGHDVICIDISRLLDLNSFNNFLHYRSGYRFLQATIHSALSKSLLKLKFQPSLIWVDGGQYYGPKILKWLRRKYGIPMVLYNIDDPTGNRDSCQFYMLKKSFSFYTLCVFVRQETSLEALALNAKKVLTVTRSFDESAHLEQSLNCVITNEHEQLSFIGTNIKGEKRDYVLVSLLRAGCPLRIIGAGWHKSSLWSLLKEFHAFDQATGADYVSFIKSSAACLGLLSHLNRDLITTRSLEIPACSGILCAEKTSEHQLLYEDQVEALFWTNTNDCAGGIHLLLNDSNLRSRIRGASARHVQAMGVGNEDICRYILSLVYD